MIHFFWVSRKCRQRVNHSMIHSPSRFFPPTGRKGAPQGPHLLADGFASIAFGYPNANLGALPKPRCAAAARQPPPKKQETANKENFIFAVYSKKYFSTLKIEYTAQSVRSTEREREMLAPGWPLWPERFHNDPRRIPSATGISPPWPFEWWQWYAGFPTRQMGLHVSGCNP